MKNNNDVLVKIIKRAITSIIIWTIILCIIFYFLKEYFNLADFQWIYDMSPDLYYSLKYNYLNNNAFFVVIFTIWASGVLIIIIRLFLKFKKFTFSLTNAIDEIYNKDVDYIELPNELEELQNKLNRFKRESEKNERLARENEQRKNDLIVYLAHDLKTPLTSTIGYLSLLDEVKDMPKEQREKYIKTALERANKLEDLINELFDIARFNSETIILNKEKLNLNMMLEQIVDDFYPLLKENNKQIKLVNKDRIELIGDSSKLARVFSNLIKNAIYYSDDENINIKISKQDDKALIVVTNKGYIPKEKINKIFEKFYRADYSRNTKTGGSGLGLAIAKEIVELHNGNIHATCEDKFTKFYVELPIN